MPAYLWFGVLQAGLSAERGRWLPAAQPGRAGPCVAAHPAVQRLAAAGAHAGSTQRAGGQGASAARAAAALSLPA